LARRAPAGCGPQACWLCCSLVTYRPGYRSSLAPRQRAWGPAAKCEVISARALSLLVIRPWYWSGCSIRNLRLAEVFLTGLSGTDGSGIWPCQSPESGRKSDRTSGDKKFACAARSALIVLRRISPGLTAGAGPSGPCRPTNFSQGPKWKPTWITGLAVFIRRWVFRAKGGERGALTRWRSVVARLGLFLTDR